MLKIYIFLPGQQNMGKQVSSLQRSVQDFWLARREGGIRINAMNPAMNSAPTGLITRLEVLNRE
jgi:hypothetical protein